MSEIGWNPDEHMLKLFVLAADALIYPFHWNTGKTHCLFFLPSVYPLDPQVRLAALRWPNHPRFNSSSPLRSCLRSSERKAFCVRAAGNGGWSWWYSRTLPQGERGTRLKMAAVKMCVQGVMWHPPTPQPMVADWLLIKQNFKLSLIGSLGSAQCVRKQNYII